MHVLFVQRALKTDYQNKKSIETYKVYVRKHIMKKKKSIHRELDRHFEEVMDYVHDNFSIFTL